jgi:APA family basic amino acid/polyamine antiporter
VIVSIGIVLVLHPETLVDNIELGVAPTWGNFALAIAVGMIAYTGIETLSNMSEEARDAPRTVPKAVALVVTAVLLLFLLIPMVALSAMPVTVEGGEYTTALATTYAENPMLGIVDNLGLAEGVTDVMRIYVGVLAAIILVIATNAGLIGLSRLTFSMGQYRQLPEAVRAIHPRFKTPYVAILLFGAISAVALLPGETELLATMYAFGAMLSFTVAHVSVIKLRSRFPDAESRTYKPRGNVRAFGFSWPLTALFGGLGIGTAWMAVGMAVYLLYRRNQGLGLRQTVKVVTPEPLGVEEVEYRSIVVAFEDGEPFSEEMVATAVKLASKRRRGIHVHALLTVPTHLALDAELPDSESEALSKIEQAKLIGGQRVTGHVERVRPGQAGYSIAAEAKEIEAAAVVVGLRYRNGTPLYDKTLQTVLGERPCRVIVVSDPTLESQPWTRPDGSTAAPSAPSPSSS